MTTLPLHVIDYLTRRGWHLSPVADTPWTTPDGERQVCDSEAWEWWRAAVGLRRESL